MRVTDMTHNLKQDLSIYNYIEKIIFKKISLEFCNASMHFTLILFLEHSFLFPNAGCYCFNSNHYKYNKQFCCKYLAIKKIHIFLNYIMKMHMKNKH